MPLHQLGLPLGFQNQETQVTRLYCTLHKAQGSSQGSALPRWKAVNLTLLPSPGDLMPDQELINHGEDDSNRKEVSAEVQILQ